MASNVYGLREDDAGPDRDDGLRQRRRPALPPARPASGVQKARFPMPGWLSLLCGLVALVAAAYLLYAVLRPESF